MTGDVIVRSQFTVQILLSINIILRFTIGTNMPSGALFGNSSALGGSSGGAKHLVEFRAGRMNMKGKMVHPDKRKGFLYLYQSDDSLIHFCWKDRTSGVVEDDLIIFPDDCEFVKVTQCTTGRVFVLKFKTSSRKLFFWMQEPKTDKDEEWCRRINEVLNNPPAVGSGGRGGSSNAPDGDLQNLLNNMSQQQLMQLFGGVGQMGGLSSLLGTMSRPSTGGSRGTTSSTPSLTRSATATSTPTTTSTSSESPKPAAVRTNAARPSPAETPTPVARQQIQLSDLQNYLSTLTSPPGTAPASATAAAPRQNVDISNAVTSEALSTVATDANCAAELQPHLPSVGEASTQEQLRSTLVSPQFQQALSMFSSALQSGQLGPVVSQFDVNSEAVAAANQGDLEQFIKALEGKTPSTPKNPPSDPKDKKDDDDEGMSLG